jgi:AcrR family transcriptional regulator
MSTLSTYDQILEESLNLFNTIGVATSSIHRISESLAISSGNLTYHFKRKRDIVAKHLENFEARLMNTIEQFPVRGGPQEFVDGWSKILGITQQYKFIFTSTAYLVQSKLITLEEFDILIGHIHVEIKIQAEKLIRAGLMKPMAEPFTVDSLVDCIWWQWLGWLNVNQLHLTYGADEDDNNLFAGVKNILFLIYPYIKKTKYRNAIIQLIGERTP